MKFQAVPTPATPKPEAKTETNPAGGPARVLPPAAQRALAEAAARRAAIDEAAKLPPEKHGRGGPEPVRYGDWEVKGIASDF